MSGASLSVGLEIPDTTVEGPRVRYAIWLQGCPLRCPECSNPELQPFEGGVWTSVDALLERVLRTPAIDGITLLGGEPFAQSSAAAILASRVREAGRSVVVFSGYTLEQLRARPDAASLLEQTDLLIDGPYLRGQPDPRRRWIGSRNQRTHFLSSYFDPNDPTFEQSDELEFRLRAGSLTIVGRPWGAGLP